MKNASISGCWQSRSSDRPEVNAGYILLPSIVYAAGAENRTSVRLSVARLARFLLYRRKGGAKAMYIGGGVLLVILVIILLIWVL